MRVKRGENYFSLIEMMVVLAVLSILLSLLHPSLVKVLESSRSLHCQNNLAKIGIAYHQYADDHEGWLTLLGRNRINWELGSYLSMDVPGDRYTGEITRVSSKNTVWECLTTNYEDNQLNELPIFGGYAVNYNYLGYLENHSRESRRRQHISTVTKPEETIVMGDGPNDAQIYWHLRYYMLSDSYLDYTTVTLA